MTDIIERQAPVPAPAPPTSAPVREARRRVDSLVDHGTFEEFGSRATHRNTAFGAAARRPAGDGVITGTARIGGRNVTLFSQDVSSLGGSVGEVHAAKITRALDLAGRTRTPVVGLLDSGGARIQEGVGALDGYGAIFRRNSLLSGRVPQVSVVLGSCAGGAAYSPALTDIVIMAPQSRMFLTGPAVIKAVTFEDVTAEEIGGPGIHSRKSGVAHLVGTDVDDAIRLAGEVLGYLPDSCWSPPPTCMPVPPEPMPDVPTNHRIPFDVRQVVRGVVDAGSMLELQAGFAPNLVTAFGRIEGGPVGVVANQPMRKAGTLDIAAAEKAARFVRLCDAFGLPIVTFVDTPGFLPGTAQESGGVIRKGAKLLYAYSAATVPRITVVLRKAFGGAYIVMNSRSLGADAVYAWPGAELAVMGAEGAIDVIFRRELAADPTRRDELVASYRREAMTAELAAERMSVDEVIDPADTRWVVAGALRSLAGARQPEFRHDNLPQ